MRSNHFSTILLLLAVLAGCGGDSGSPAEVLSPGDLPEGEMMFGINHVMTTQGVRSVVLAADTAFMQENGRRWDLRGVHLNFFDETGAESGTLTSRAALYTPDTGSFVARDSVVLVTQTPKGTRVLETEELYYDVNTEEMWSDSSWVMNDAGSISRGRSFRSDVKGDSWTATGLITEDITTGDSGPTF
jgi:LPS export ABC transporter protein LptC